MTQLYYEFLGNPARPTIVFLHGFLGSVADWYEMLDGLGDQYSYLLVDLPGHGASLLTDYGHYSMPSTARLVHKLVEQVIADRKLVQLPFLYGYSMGGRLALYMALQYPQLFKKVILESASPGLNDDRQREQRRQRDEALANHLELMTKNDFADFLSRWYQQPLFQSLRQHPKFHQMLTRRLQNTPSHLAKSLRYMGTGAQPNLWPELMKLALPSHFVTGEVDQKFVKLQIAMLPSSPGATVSVIQQTGHNVHLENTAAILSEITNFFI